MSPGNIDVFELHQIRTGRLPLTQIKRITPSRAKDVFETREQTVVRYSFTSLAVMLALTNAAVALTPAEQRGRTFVINNCSRCHAVDKVSPSPLTIAPPFRDLHKRYPIETLQEGLAEGLSTGHPTMPEFRLEPDQINDVLSYLKSLE